VHARLRVNVRLCEDWVGVHIKLTDKSVALIIEAAEVVSTDCDIPCLLDLQRAEGGDQLSDNWRLVEGIDAVVRRLLANGVVVLPVLADLEERFGP
jgi:hypothetical protein